MKKILKKMYAKKKMSLEYIYNNITKYKDIDKDMNKYLEIDIIYRKKSNRQNAKTIKQIAEKQK